MNAGKRDETDGNGAHGADHDPADRMGMDGAMRARGCERDRAAAGFDQRPHPAHVGDREPMRLLGHPVLIRDTLLEGHHPPMKYREPTSGLFAYAR